MSDNNWKWLLTLVVIIGAMTKGFLWLLLLFAIW